MAVPTRRAASPGTVRSPRTPRASTPISATSWAKRSSDLPASTSFAPLLAKRRATARPIPELAPVTTTTAPSMLASVSTCGFPIFVAPLAHTRTATEEWAQIARQAIARQRPLVTAARKPL